MEQKIELIMDNLKIPQELWDPKYKLAMEKKKEVIECLNKREWIEVTTSAGKFNGEIVGRDGFIVALKERKYCDSIYTHVIRVTEIKENRFLGEYIETIDEHKMRVYNYGF